MGLHLLESVLAVPPNIQNWAALDVSKSFTVASHEWPAGGIASTHNPISPVCVCGETRDWSRTYMWVEPVSRLHTHHEPEMIKDQIPAPKDTLQTHTSANDTMMAIDSMRWHHV